MDYCSTYCQLQNQGQISDLHFARNPAGPSDYLLVSFVSKTKSQMISYSGTYWGYMYVQACGIQTIHITGRDFRNLIHPGDRLGLHKFVEATIAAEPTVAARFVTSVRHSRFILDGETVDVHGTTGRRVSWKHKKETLDEDGFRTCV